MCAQEPAPAPVASTELTLLRYIQPLALPVSAPPEVCLPCGQSWIYRHFALIEVDGHVDKVTFGEFLRAEPGCPLATFLPGSLSTVSPGQELGLTVLVCSCSPSW